MCPFLYYFSTRKIYVYKLKPLFLSFYVSIRCHLSSSDGKPLFVWSKVFLVHAMESFRSIGIASIILYIGLFIPGKELRYPLSRRLGGPRAVLSVLENRKVLPLPGFFFFFLLDLYSMCHCIQHRMSTTCTIGPSTSTIKHYYPGHSPLHTVTFGTLTGRASYAPSDWQYTPQAIIQVNHS